jgi:hypothetical protein
MSYLFDLALHAFLVLSRSPFMAFTGFTVMGLGAARVLPAGSLIRGVLLPVAIFGALASGLAIAMHVIGGPGWQSSLVIR